jgi:hypothetical protein
MEVIGFRQLNKKDVPLRYRNEFSGLAVFKTDSEKTIEKKVTFVLERMANGKRDVTIDIQDDIDYPLLPIVKNLKSYILDLDEKGQLP